jgi:hypothetical protein
MQTKQSKTNSNIRSTVIAAIGLLSTLLAVSHTAQAQGTQQEEPVVFQAAGANAGSIQNTVDAFRAALGNPNNGNNPGPLTTGHREINWDGGNPNVIATTPPVTPFNTFLNTRGSQFITNGTGLSQATPAGLAVLFNNPTYATIFSTFSPSRLFTPVGSNITEGSFFVPGTNGSVSAAVKGFGAVFTDVDQQRGNQRGARHSNRRSSTTIEVFDEEGELIFRGSVPAGTGDGSLSFFGILFEEPRIASVRIETGNVAPGPNDDKQHDVVMMDDFIYGEPEAAH